MAQRAGVVVHVELLEVQGGLWCRDCLLSSGLQLAVATTVGSRTELHVKRVCDDCDGTNVEPT